MPAYTMQRELVSRLHLPFSILADPDRRLAEALRLPTFEAAGETLYRRLTMVIRDGRIEHVFFPVFPPNTAAETVVAWLEAHPK